MCQSALNKQAKQIKKNGQSLTPVYDDKKKEGENWGKKEQTEHREREGEREREREREKQHRGINLVIFSLRGNRRSCFP